MSHIATVKTKIKDHAVLADVCRELGVSLEVKRQQVPLYSGTVAAVATIRLPGWRYPVVVEADGSVRYDNYGGTWGAQRYLNKLLCRYSEKITTQQARRMGMTVRRQEQPDGTVVLRLGS